MLPFRMRVQLQLKKNTESIAVVGRVAITVAQVHNALDRLVVKAYSSGWFPNRAHGMLGQAVWEMKLHVQKYPPGGTNTQGAGNIYRKEFVDNGICYRLDLENNAGNNLTS